MILGSARQPILGETPPACRLWPRIIFGNAGQNHWRTVGKLGDQRKVPTHGLDRFSERGQQEIAPLFVPLGGDGLSSAQKTYWSHARAADALPFLERFQHASRKACQDLASADGQADDRGLLG
jgi:hypothetical protein